MSDARAVVASDAGVMAVERCRSGDSLSGASQVGVMGKEREKEKSIRARSEYKFNNLKNNKNYIFILFIYDFLFSLDNMYDFFVNKVYDIKRIMVKYFISVKIIILFF